MSSSKLLVSSLVKIWFNISALVNILLATRPVLLTSSFAKGNSLLLELTYEIFFIVLSCST